MTKLVQFFNSESVEASRGLSPTEVANFLHDYQQMFFSNEGPRKLISMRVPEKVLRLFKMKCELAGVSYQRKIVELMRLSLKT